MYLWIKYWEKKDKKFSNMSIYQHILELISLRGGKHFNPRPQNRILVPLERSIQNFRRAYPVLLYGSPPGAGWGTIWLINCKVVERPMNSGAQENI